MGHPCSANPELWFGYADDDGGDGAAKARAYEQSATEARLQCLRRCPLAQQRLCARYAVENREEYGVWAGVKLPGGQYRKRDQLARAHDVLRRIAAGEINSRQLPENAAPPGEGADETRSRWPARCLLRAASTRPHCRPAGGG